SATPGWYGKRSFGLAAILMNSRGICVSLQRAPQLAGVSHPHMPLRSGLPSGVRGPGADMSGVPSRVRGTPGVGYSSHCADITPETATTMTAAAEIRRHLVGMRLFLKNRSAH